MQLVLPLGCGASSGQEEELCWWSRSATDSFDDVSEFFLLKLKKKPQLFDLQFEAPPSLYISVQLSKTPPPNPPTYSPQHTHILVTAPLYSEHMKDDVTRLCLLLFVKRHLAGLHSRRHLWPARPMRRYRRFGLEGSSTIINDLSDSEALQSIEDPPSRGPGLSPLCWGTFVIKGLWIFISRLFSSHQVTEAGAGKKAAGLQMRFHG